MFRPASRQIGMNALTPRDPRTPSDLRGSATERDAWLHLARNADRPALADAGLSVTQLGRATVLRCRPGGPLTNRAFDVPADPDAVRAVCAHFAAEAVPLFFLHLEDPDADRRERAAAAAGLVRYRRRMSQLVRRAGPVHRRATSLDVGPPATVEELLHAARIFCTAFDATLALAPVFASLHGSPRWRFVIARERSLPVALGMLYVDGEVGYLVGGATSPRCRGLGAQGALIAARLELANELGCREVGVHTGEAAPGDPQHSYRNLIRHGFDEVGLVDSFAPPGIVWTHGRRAVGLR